MAKTDLRFANEIEKEVLAINPKKLTGGKATIIRKSQAVMRSMIQSRTVVARAKAGGRLPNKKTMISN